MDIFLLVSQLPSSPCPSKEEDEYMFSSMNQFGEKRSRGTSIGSPCRLSHLAQIKRSRGSHSSLKRGSFQTSHSSDSDDQSDDKNTGVSAEISGSVTDETKTKSINGLTQLPVSERLSQAKKRRQELLHEEVTKLKVETSTKLIAANLRARDYLIAKTDKARFDERVRLVKERRDFLYTERKLTVEVQSQIRSSGALKRAEQNLINKAIRSSPDARVSKAQERRTALESRRLVSLRGKVMTRSKGATLRARYQLQLKISKAKYDDRIDRARQRRKIIEYERRTALLSTLDHRTERAAYKADVIRRTKQRKAREDVRHAQMVAKRVRAARIIQRAVRHSGLLEHRSNRAEKNARYILEDKQKKAREDVKHAQLVARRVRAARVIQRTVRNKHNFERSSSSRSAKPKMNQKQATVCMQTWKPWMVRVVAHRFLSDASANNNTKHPRDALFSVLSVFEEQNSFEQVRMGMQHPSTLSNACTVLYSIRPLLNCAEKMVDQRELINERTFLSALLISTYPQEVLAMNEENSVNTKFVEWASRGLHSLLREITSIFATGPSSDVNTMMTRLLSKLVIKVASYSVAFHEWKDADLKEMISGMTKSAEQSWVVYLTACEALRYLEMLSSSCCESGTTSKERLAVRFVDDDPLISLRLRHEASKSGSRSHLKRIRVSLNKLVGNDGGFQIMTEAKSTAMKQMQEENVVEAFKSEIDLFCSSGGHLSNNTGQGETSEVEDANVGVKDNCFVSSSEDEAPSNTFMSDASEAIKKDTEEHHTSRAKDLYEKIPNSILSNEQLIHKILLTDPSDFHHLTWDGLDRTDASDVAEFMTMFESGQFHFSKTEQSRGVGEDATNLQKLISEGMKRAFYDLIIEDVRIKKLDSIRKLMKELYQKIRQLVPHRTDLHNHLCDEDIMAAQSVADLILAQLKAGEALASYLESPARACSTIEWTEAAVSSVGHSKLGIPFGFSSIELFLVASVAFLLHKTDLCQMDIANTRLVRVAPLIHEMGHDYERRNFEEKYCTFGAPLDTLKDSVPGTWAWIKDYVASGEVDFLRESHNKRMSLVQSRAFVDGLLFAEDATLIPEILSMDTESIMNIRAEARYAVIGSALVLHTCNVSGFGAVALCSAPPTKALVVEKTNLLSALKAQHSNHDSLVAAVSEAAIMLAGVISSKALDKEADTSLRNCVASVLRGDDPVIKLLDNRIRQLFRLMCKWQLPDVCSQSGSTPVLMKTGRPLMKDGHSGQTKFERGNSDTTKEAFLDMARKEASKRGFSLFANEIARAGAEMRAVINLSCALYGKAILDPLILSECCCSVESRSGV